MVDVPNLFLAVAMKLEAVIVCVDYADFLAFTLPLNKHFFNRLVVVTSTKDERTKKLCEFWHVQCVQTDVFYQDGSPFNKGAGINEGLKALDGSGWVLHLDADIVLPPQFRVILENLRLDEEGLYTADRMMCDSFENWLAYFMQPTLSNEANTYVHPRPFPMGVRLSKSDFGGWLPLGYFQLWNQGKRKLTYPTQNDDAGHSDLRFAQLFSREHRHLLGEFYVIHLETKSPGQKMGANWKGRKTPPFAPSQVTQDDKIAAYVETPTQTKKASMLSAICLGMLTSLTWMCSTDQGCMCPPPTVTVIQAEKPVKLPVICIAEVVP